MRRPAVGFVAGMWATLAMAGVGLTIRRLTTDAEALGKTDPEHAVEWIFSQAGREPPVRLRRQLADSMHLLVGGTGGACYAALTRQRDVSPWRGGASTAAVMWLLGFCGYMPVLGILPPPWQWPARKFVITSSAHLAYGWTMAMLLRALGHRTGSLQLPDRNR